jgi:hypothetical protein
VAVLMPALALASVVPPLPRADAAPLPPGFADPALRDADLARIVHLLETRVVTARLRALGLDAAAVEARLARLDAAELHRLAEAMPEAGLGGEDWERGLGIALLYIVAIVIFGGLIYLAIASGSAF